MSHPPIRRCLTAALLASLPASLAGCLALNAAFGVLGLVATGPVQYAGTAYTVGEYAYHYAVNDMTPVEVFEDKFAWLDRQDVQPTSPGQPDSPPLPPSMEPPAIELADAGGIDTEVIAAEATPAAERRSHRTPQHPPLSAPTAAPDSASTPQPVMLASRAPLRPVAPSTRGVQVREAAPDVSGTPPAVVTAQASPSLRDPLAARLDRFESALAQAERMYLRHQGQGVRCGASTAEHSGDEAGVSGTGLVRHPVMRHGPDPVASLSAAARHPVTYAPPALL
jgi:hypothetical protein